MMQGMAPHSDKNMYTEMRTGASLKYTLAITAQIG